MSVQVPRPGSFETALGARLRAELDALPVSPLRAWPVMRRTRRIAFATAAAVAVASALLIGAVGAFAYGSPGVWVQNVAHNFQPRQPEHDRTVVGPAPEASPTTTVTPSRPPPIERQSPGPGSGEHESPEPTRPSGGESPEPREGSSPSPPPDE